MTETLSFDQAMGHCATLRAQKQVLLDGLHEIDKIINKKEGFSKYEVQEVIVRTFRKEAITH